MLKKAVLLLSNIGKGLRQNPATKLVDVQLSADAGNGLSFGSDNGLLLIPQAGFMTIIGHEEITASVAGFVPTVPAGAKAFRRQVIGGGASGVFNGSNTGNGNMPGGIPGDIVDEPVQPIALLPMAMDIVIGAGGPALTASGVGANGGGNTTISVAGVTVLEAFGGAPGALGGTVLAPNVALTGRPRNAPASTPGASVSGYSVNGIRSQYGPGAGGCGFFSFTGAALKGGNGAASKAGPLSLAGALVTFAANGGEGGGITIEVRDGLPGQDDLTGFGFGGGGGGGGAYTTGGGSGGAGGTPGGGGGGGGGATNGTRWSGAGGRGAVRIYYYG